MPEQPAQSPSPPTPFRPLVCPTCRNYWDTPMHGLGCPDGQG